MDLRDKRLITDICHQLKTPLSIISVNLEIMKMEVGDIEWIDDCLTECKRMEMMINQMNSVALMNEKKNKLEFEQVDLSRLLQDTVREFRGVASEKRIEIDCAISRGTVCRGNEDALHHMIYIIMDNAVKYCDAKGTVSVSLQCADEAVLEIENTYKNIDKIRLEKIFDRFYREEDPDGRDGSGIGLSIAEKIVDLHGGEIRAYKRSSERIGFRIVIR